MFYYGLKNFELEINLVMLKYLRRLILYKLLESNFEYKCRLRIIENLIWSKR